MKISDMSKAELSRWIAEKREPFLTLPEATEPILLGERGRPSPLKAWCETSDYETGDVPYWRPRDFVDDPLTLMLMGELLNTKKAYWLEKRDDEIIFGRVNTVRATPRISLGRAVAEEWALVNGFQEE